MDEIEQITPPKLPKGAAISLGKFKAKIMRMGGISDDLLGSVNSKCNVQIYQDPCEYKSNVSHHGHTTATD